MKLSGKFAIVAGAGNAATLSLAMHGVGLEIIDLGKTNLWR